MTQSRDNMIQRRRQSTALYGRQGLKADYGEVRKGKAAPKQPTAQLPGASARTTTNKHVHQQELLQ